MLKKSLFVPFVWQRYLERNTEGKTEDSGGRVLYPSWWMKKGWNENSPHLKPPAGHWKLTPSSLSFSLHLFPSLCGCQTILNSEGWTLDSCSGIASRLMTPSRPPPAEWPVKDPVQTALESPTCLKCTQMQFDLSSGLWEAHFATAALLFIVFTIRSLKEKKKKRYLPSDVFVWFRPALVSDCCLVCSANISYPACGSFSITFCCVKTNGVFQKNAEARTERGSLWVERKNSAVYCNVVGWKDIANILTITCFPGCFFAGGCFVLLYIELSAD